MRQLNLTPHRSFALERLSPGDGDAPLDPWAQAEIDRLRERNRFLGDTTYQQSESLDLLRGLLRALQELPAATTVAQALSETCLSRGVCASCWRSVIPDCGCNRG